MRYFKTNIRETLFFVIYTIYLLTLILGYSCFDENDTFRMICQMLRYVCYLLAIIKILWDSFYKKQLYMLILLAAVMAATALSSGNKTFLFYFIMIMAAKDMDIKGIIKVTCVVQGVCLLFLVLSSQAGLIPDYIFDPNTRMRHGLGFGWTTTAPIMFFFFMMSYIYLRGKQTHTVEIIVLELINYWLYVKTDARMSFYLSTLFLIYIFVMRFFWYNREQMIRKNKILVLAPAVMCVISLFLHLAYNENSAVWTKLNDVLSGRLKLGYDGFHTYGLTLFGTPIEWIGFSHSAKSGVYNYVDCSYMQILLENGIAVLLVVVLMYTYIMYKAVQQKDFYLQTVILAIVVFSVTEPRLLNLAFNPFAFLAVTYMGTQNEHSLMMKRNHIMGNIRFRSSHVRVRLRR